MARELGKLHGSLRVALPVSFGIRHMGEPIAEFSRRHSRVELDLDFNDRRIDLLEENVDIAIRIGPLADSILIARRLFEAPTVICGSPD